MWPLLYYGNFFFRWIDFDKWLLFRFLWGEKWTENFYKFFFFFFWGFRDHSGQLNCCNIFLEKKVVRNFRQFQTDRQGERERERVLIWKYGNTKKYNNATRLSAFHFFFLFFFIIIKMINYIGNYYYHGGKGKKERSHTYKWGFGFPIAPPRARRSHFASRLLTSRPAPSSSR